MYKNIVTWLVIACIVLLGMALFCRPEAPQNGVREPYRGLYGQNAAVSVGNYDFVAGYNQHGDVYIGIVIHF